MTDPLVSVIVPVFNGADTLERSVDSLLDQSLKALEIILINDGSSDGSGDLIDRLAAKHPQIRAVHNEHNQGVHETRLNGLRAATAPWIGFLDADDIARPEMFERMQAAGEEHQADIVVCGAYRVTGDRKVISPKLRFRDNATITRDIFPRFCQFRFGTGMLWNKLFRRELIMPYADLHFPWRQNINEDLILNIGCFKDANTVHLMKGMLYEYVFRDTSVSTSGSVEKACLQTLRAYAIAVSLFRDSGDEVLAEITNMYRQQLSWPPYRLDDTRTMSSFGAEIREAVELIMDCYPAGLGGLTTTPPSAPMSVGRVVRALSRRFLGEPV
ncbi:glycosyltransferase family 2 protein [Marinobacter sp. M1N3S26]|uniref:glycosyltransferase family 2 protein n=1 Tax=Marinobacter sp. M1N3S26 TaxID=3382299 RepID=UPI00387B48D2